MNCAERDLESDSFKWQLKLINDCDKNGANQPSTESCLLVAHYTEISCFDLCSHIFISLVLAPSRINHIL